MSATAVTGLPPVCPRCRAATVDLRSASPVPGVWSVFGCSTCLYSRRSTEPDENTDPEKYPAAFRLNPADMPNLPVIPTIPPRRTPASTS